jgi:hypothetical protein
LDMVVTVRTGSSLRYEQVVKLQKAIVDGIHMPVSLKVSQVIAENLDPLIPPTRTFTPTLTSTSTLGPSPTATHTSTPTLTTSPTVTNTATSTLPQFLRPPLHLHPRLHLHLRPPKAKLSGFHYRIKGSISARVDRSSVICTPVKKSLFYTAERLITA